MKATIPRVMFAAFNSGSGKTTITCAVLKAFAQQGLDPAAFKCGPDYIDPMFHSEVIGVKSRNLDLFMLNEETVKYLLVKNARQAKLAVLEGVMGYYDGLGANSTTASSYHLAAVTRTPVILIVNCKGSSLSLAALIKGFVEFRADSMIKGVILNQLSAPLYPLYKKMIEAETGIEVLGYFPWLQESTLGSRHLGLITAAEIDDLSRRITLLTDQACQSIDLDRIRQIAVSAQDLDYCDLPVEKIAAVMIAVAKDKAFSFYYQDSLELLERAGATLIPFSPLTDAGLPECDGLILGGGYPEVYARQLAENGAMRASVRSAIHGGLPCIAECGGFMYLLNQITADDTDYEMVGNIPGKAYMTPALSRFGYIRLVAQSDNMLCAAGETIHAHEFHYSDSTANGNSFIAVKPSGARQWPCIHAGRTLFAGYPHLHLWSNPNFAYSFIRKCSEYRSARA